jgi:hypothetical protein
MDTYSVCTHKSGLIDLLNSKRLDLKLNLTAHRILPIVFIVIFLVALSQINLPYTYIYNSNPIYKSLNSLKVSLVSLISADKAYTLQINSNPTDALMGNF